MKFGEIRYNQKIPGLRLSEQFAFKSRRKRAEVLLLQVSGT